MAVIQDLPAELMYRILELVEVRGRDDLLSTSLVTRDWTVSSQALLLRKVDCLSATNMRAITRHLAYVKFARVHHLDLNLYEPSMVQPTSDLLKAAEGLRSLRVLGWWSRPDTRYDTSTLLSSKVMANLEALQILAQLEGALSLSSQIPLRSLELSISDLPPPAILDTILHSASNLQSFGLYVNTSAPLPQSILDVAGRLTRLRLTDGGDELKSSCPSCLPLLAACTGLRTLELEGWKVGIVAKMLRACRSELVGLTTTSLVEDDSAVYRHRPLRDALEFSSLAKLKRWRVSWMDDLELSGRSKWRRACETRGIEAEERSVTSRTEIGTRMTGAGDERGLSVLHVAFIDYRGGTQSTRISQTLKVGAESTEVEAG